MLGQPVALTGEHRDRGLAAQRGVQIAIDEINADPALHVAGKRVAAIHADTASKLDNVGSQAVRLTTINRVHGIVGGLTAAEGRALAEVARTYEVPVMSVSGVAGGKSAFSLGIRLDDRVRAIDRYLSNREPHALQILADSADPRWATAGESLARAFRSRGRSATVTEYTAPLKQPPSGEGHRVVFGHVSDANRIAGGSVVFAGDEVDCPELRVGGIYLASYSPTPSAAAGAFSAKYRGLFGSAAPPEAAMMYDATHTLVAGLRATKSASGPRLRDYFLVTSFDRLSGPVRFGSDQVARGVVYVVEKTDSGSLVRDKWEAEAAKPSNP